MQSFTVIPKQHVNKKTSHNQNVGNGQQALEKLFDALEEYKQDDLKEDDESLKNTFEDDFKKSIESLDFIEKELDKKKVFKKPTYKEEKLLKQIELLESNLKTLEKELGYLKYMLK